MGMYTEFYFRANIEDGPITTWLDSNINGGRWFDSPFRANDEHPFFKCERWTGVFMGGGAVYQESRPAVLRPKSGPGTYRNQLVIASSLKNYGDEIAQFIDWISPHLDMGYGDFLGYSLYEDSCDDSDEYREHPTLYFHKREAVWDC